MPSIHTIGKSQFPQVATLYNECGYAGGINNSDMVFVAKIEDRVIAAVRLCQERGVMA